MTLDPQIADLIETLDAGFPPVHTMTGAQARAVIRSRFVRTANPKPSARSRDASVAGPGGRHRGPDLPPGAMPGRCRLSSTPMAADLCSATSTATTGCAATWPI